MPFKEAEISYSIALVGDFIYWLASLLISILLMFLYIFFSHIYESWAEYEEKKGEDMVMDSNEREMIVDGVVYGVFTILAINIIFRTMICLLCGYILLVSKKKASVGNITLIVITSTYSLVRGVGLVLSSLAFLFSIFTIDISNIFPELLSLAYSLSGVYAIRMGYTILVGHMDGTFY